MAAKKGSSKSRSPKANEQRTLRGRSEIAEKEAKPGCGGYSPEPADLQREPSHWLAQCLVVFSLALVLRLLHFWAMSRTLIYDVLIGDAWQYDRWAQEIAGGDWIGKEVFYQTPLYPYFLAIIYSIGGHSVWAARIVQAVLGSLACILVARAGTRFFFDSRVGWVAGLLLAVYPPAIFFDGILQKATLDLLLTSAVLWSISRMPSEATLGWTLLLGCLLGLLILNRENAWVFVPVLLAWVVWQQRTKLPGLKGAGPIAALILGILIVLGPVGLRNYYVGGEFLLTTSQMGPNFYIGNHSGATGRYVSLRPDRGDPRFERTDARILAERAEGRPMTPREVSTYWMRRSWADISSAPLDWCRLIVRKWYLTWNQVEMVDGEGIRVHSWYSPVLMGTRWFLNFGILSAVAVAGAWLARRRFRELWVLYLMTLAFALAVTIFYVFARYRYPLVPMVAVFSAFGLVEVWRIISGSKPFVLAELITVIGLSVLSAIATCWPNSDYHSDEVTYFSVGTALNELGRREDAIQQFQEAIKIKPDFAQAYINMGTTAMKMKQWDMAENHLRESLRINPNNPVALQNLANIAIEKGDKEKAERFCRQAINLDPFMIPALQSLARILVQRGETGEAVRLMHQAVEADRLSPQAISELGLTLVADKQYQAAAEAFESALQLSPSNILVANNLAWLLATGPSDVRNGKRAIELAQQVCETVDYKTPVFIDTLAAAYAELGQFDKAIESAELALNLVQQNDPTQNSQPISERLQLYRCNRPYRDNQTQK